MTDCRHRHTEEPCRSCIILRDGQERGPLTLVGAYDVQILNLAAAEYLKGKKKPTPSTERTRRAIERTMFTLTDPHGKPPI